MTSLTIDREYVTRTLADLVRINSINPSLVPGAPGEVEIADHVEKLMTNLGMTVARHDAAPGRPSVVGRLHGRGGGRSLMLNGHMDTVAVDGMADPFSAEIRDGRLYGRGSQDMKGSLAACFGAVKALVDSGQSLAGDLLIAAVADEEHASIGTADIVRRYQVDGAIVTEPTNLDLATAHKGFVWIEVETTGRAAHGSRFDEGIDANLHMGRFLHELARLERDLRGRTAHPLVGPPSLHAATITGGSGLSTYAAKCTLQIERRTIPGETEAQVVGEIEAIARGLSNADPIFRISVRSTLARSAFETPAGSRVAEAVERSATAILGRAPKRIGKGGWMDSALLGAAGVDTVIFGPIGEGLHTEVEWVDLDSVARTAHVLADAARGYCG